MIKQSIFFLLLFGLFMDTNAQNAPVKEIELAKYSGKWYSLASIPTFLDKNWKETIENYTMNNDGFYDVLTTYKKDGSDKLHDIKSKLFPGDKPVVGEMKAQFVWPFKAGYRVIEIGSDYSYTVVGHPKQKFLFIMSREPTMDPALYKAIVSRCKTSGYDVDKLKSQDHPPK